MAVHFQPKGYTTVIPYLVVPDVRGLMAFLEAAFSGERVEVMETPDGGVAHAEVRIGDTVVMMGAAQPGKAPYRAMLYVYVPDCDAAYKKAIAAGATAVREPADQFYGDRSGGVADKWGNEWWIGTHQETVSKEELDRRHAEAQKNAKK